MFTEKEKLPILLDIVNKEPIVALPIMSDYSKHYMNSDISFLYIFTVKSNKEFIISYNHYDIESNITYSKDLLKNCPQIHVWDSKIFRNLYINDNVIDHGLINYLDINSQLDAQNYETHTHKFYQNEYWKYGNINNIIPIMKHLETCRHMTKLITNKISIDLPESFTPYNDDVIRVYSQIEKSGLCINTNEFLESFGKYSKKHIKNNTVFTQYNMYTTTGRPSNSHGGVNYAALNKDDGSRKCFISRHENGRLVEFDFDSYHLRLIATIINEKLPDSSIHKYFGKMYFNKENLSAAEYVKSKEISFKILYGGVPDEYKHIPFFSKIDRFINDLYNDMLTFGYVKTALLNRKMIGKNYESLTRTKLFNYYIQAMETESNVIMFDKILNLLNGKNTNLVLTTYDSLLFDFDINEGKKLLNDIELCFDYPVKMSVGKNYDSMKIVNK
tara:strand:+ start:4449 stop:5780 length:1332 start_codon:yes stop_codon:yes gene_type:complete